MSLGYFFAVSIAILFGIFLIWRAGEHELVEHHLLFDIILVSSLGALVFGRLLEFAVNSEKFEWSFGKLIFFNVFPGLDFFGMLFGFVVVAFYFLRDKRPGFWYIFDLVAAPIVFVEALVSLVRFISGKGEGKEVGVGWISSAIGGKYPVELIYFVGFLIIFVVLKRLAKKKRFTGFFASLFLILYGGLEVAVFPMRSGTIYINGNIPYHLAAPIAVLAFGGFSFHICSKRKLSEDFKSILAFMLLFVFSTRRTILSTNEAGKASRSIVIFPYFLLRSVLAVLVNVGKEISAVFDDLLNVLGVKK